MQLTLDIKCYIIDEKPYYRVHFSTKQARALGLQKGDKLIVEVIKIDRPTGEFNTIELKKTTLTEVIT